MAEDDALEKLREAFGADDPAKALSAMLGHNNPPTPEQQEQERAIRASFAEKYLNGDHAPEPMGLFSQILGYTPEETPPGTLQMAHPEDEDGANWELNGARWEHSERVLKAFALPFSRDGFLGFIWLDKEDVEKVFKAFLDVPLENRKQVLDAYWLECDRGRSAFDGKCRDPALKHFVRESEGQKFSVRIKPLRMSDILRGDDDDDDIVPQR